MLKRATESCGLADIGCDTLGRRTGRRAYCSRCGGNRRLHKVRRGGYLRRRKRVGGCRLSEVVARMHRRVVLIASLLLMLTGCRSLFLVLPEPTKTVKADYPYLVGKRVCILVRADMETLFEYPHVQWELADHVRVALEAHVEGVKAVDPRRVVDYQRREADWERMDPALIGRHFNADRVLDLELTQYTTREPESPHLYRGHVTAVVRVYRPSYPHSEPAYVTEIQTVYPPDGPGAWGSTDREIRRLTMEAFALDVANKFYDRKVKK